MPNEYTKSTMDSIKAEASSIFRSYICITMGLLIVVCKLCASVAVLAADTATPPTIAIGFARADITPDKSANMMGYPFEARPGNDGVNDPLLVRACALKSEEKPAVILIFDLCVLPTDWARSLRAKIAESLKVGTERVLVGATHTHSGPDPTPEYLAGIEERAIDAARRAAVMTFPTTAWVREAPLGLGYQRRVSVDSRIRMCWSPEVNWEFPPQPAPDPTLTLLAFQQTNGPRQFLLWSIGVHPVTIGQGNRFISGDYPSVACSQIEVEYPDTYSMFLLGAAGDTNPWISCQDDPRNVAKVARAASSYVGLLQRGVRPIAVGDKTVLACAAKQVVIGKTKLDLAMWRLGDAWIAAAPVELFGELGAALRQKLKGPLICSTLTNGWEKYWPTSAAVDEGGYGSQPPATPNGFTKGDGERLIDELAALADTIR
jgi:hypothetical protein